MPDRLYRWFILAMMALALASSALAHDNTQTPYDTDLRPTHDAVYGTFFDWENPKLGNLSGVAEVLRNKMWDALQSPEGEPMRQVLFGLTHPDYLLPQLPQPVQRYFRNHKNPVVKKFLCSGYLGLDTEERYALFKVMLESPFNDLRRVAATLRTSYLTAAYHLALTEPLTKIDPGPIQVPNPEEWMAKHAPKLPPSQLRYDAQRGEIIHTEDVADYLVVGSGPAGATVAYVLREAGHSVVLVDRGSFVVPNGMDTRRPSELMLNGGNVTTTDGGIFIRAGNALGGGSAVNVDLAFSPLEAAAQARISQWVAEGWVDSRDFGLEQLSEAYAWVRKTMQTAYLTEDLINRNNRVLWDGSRSYGVEPSLYQLNRQVKDSTLLDDKRSAVRQMLLGAMENVDNPLAVIPDAEVIEVLFEGSSGDLKSGCKGPYAGEGSEVLCDDLVASGVRLRIQAPWNNPLVMKDPAELGIPAGTEVTLKAKNVILAAGSIGSPEILLRTALKQPILRNPMIGSGPILHPAMPIIGEFDEHIGVLEDLRVSVFVDAFGIEPGFILEAMDAFPSYAAVMTPGRANQVFDRVVEFQNLAGFGVLLIDTPSDFNRIELDPNSGRARVNYTLSNGDKVRFRKGIEIAIRMMFLSGAKEVVIPSNENFRRRPNHDPTRGVYLECKDGKSREECAEQGAEVARNLEILPNRTIVTSAHMQASNKMGPHADISAVSWDHRVWNHITKEEILNLYVMDSSVFPTSAGVNPMQTIYTVAKIFADRLVEEEADLSLCLAQSSENP